MKWLIIAAIALAILNIIIYYNNGSPISYQTFREDPSMHMHTSGSGSSIDDNNNDNNVGSFLDALL
jgi:hypothetical protein